MPTVVLNLTQKISAIIRPLRQSLPSERSLRSAHRLSAEPRSKTNTCGPMSTRKGQAASVTLLRREQLRSASAPTNMSEVRQKIEEAGGQGRPPLQEVRRKPEERAGRLSLQRKTQPSSMDGCVLIWDVIRPSVCRKSSCAWAARPRRLRPRACGAAPSALWSASSASRRRR